MYVYSIRNDVHKILLCVSFEFISIEMLLLCKYININKFVQHKQ